MNFYPKVHHNAISAASVPIMRYDGKSDIEKWRTDCTETLSRLLGMDAFKECEPIFEITEEGELNGNRHIHFVLQTEEGYFTHCDLLLPPEQNGPLPLCVCLQGHSRGAHISLGLPKYPGDEETISGGDRDFAVRAVKEGFAALAIEQRAFGQCGGSEYGPDCGHPAMTAILLGRTLIGERVWDVSRVLDAVLVHFADICTMKGSVLTGNSGGGTATYYTACLEHRFEAYMPCCSVCSFHDSIVVMHHCVCNYVPGVAKYFDMGDMAAMIAPKKLVVICGKDDDIFPLHGVKKTYAIISDLYKAAGAPDNCALVVGEGGHRFYADAGWKAMKELLAK